MAEPCAQRNPLVRSGLTQDGRRRAELAPDHFVPDERDLPDLILFGQRFAGHIRYYGSDNKGTENWVAFFESDAVAGLAALAKLPVDAFRTFQRDLENWLRAEPTRDQGQLSAHAMLVFHLPVALVEIAAALHAKLPDDHPCHASVLRIAQENFVEPLTALIAWYKGAFDFPTSANRIFEDGPIATADYNVGGAPNDSRVRLSSTVAAALGGRKFSDAQLPDSIFSQIPAGGWATLYGNTSVDRSPYEDALGMANQKYEQIYDALNYNLLITAIEAIYQGVERIRREAAAYLKDSLENFAGHPPHFGLWLAFLRLFEHAQGEINKFTARHLDFYFREVLRLSARAAVPDKAHLLFELAKGRTAHRLAAGTRFRAGKDALGKPLAYALENDIVVSRASVAELRGLRVESTGTPAIPALMPRAAPVVRSRDGLGEVELPKDSPAWPPFGPAAGPAARIGFAIADRKLFLREGTRTITIRADLTAPLPTTDISPNWIVRLTGDEGWFELSEPGQIKTTPNNSFREPATEPDPGDKTPGKGARSLLAHSKVPARKQSRGTFRRGHGRGKRPPSYPILELTVSLGPDDPPVIPLDAKLHGADYDPGVPVMEVVFDFDPDDAANATARAFAVLRDVTAHRVTLQTEASGLRNLMVVAGGGVADPSKPFAPFGPQPRIGADFIMGSSEIFSKLIESWSLQLDWEIPYHRDHFFRKVNADVYNPGEAVLSGGSWVEPSDEAQSKTKLFSTTPTMRRRMTGTDIHLDESSADVELASVSRIDGLTEQTLENPPLDARSVNGFLRLRLPRDFGHAEFVGENTRALIGLAKGKEYTPSQGINTFGPSPGSPYPPYTPMITRLEASYTTKREPVATFGLLHPFGISEGTDDGRLFPDMPFEGALLIGVADFAPPARLTLLVQVADGSGDPLKAAPDLEFAFLDGDNWADFESQAVDDKTVNFSRSGVLGLSLPEAADTGHDILPADRHWIRITARRDADALNRLLSIDAQAARVSFAESDNDPAFLETPLPAGSISKLVTPELAIKKIVQPYSSFGGRPAEPDDAFAVRVSERLRHKDRAVTMYDCEALVLEAFPRLYRVKCLGTTELMRDRDAGNRIVADNELMPGAITVVTVPRTQGENARDPLRPYTDQATLTGVDRFLRQRLSPFVRLEVQNPKFEEAHVDFKVRFKPEVGDILFYTEALNAALVDFLTPWARRGGGEITFGGRLWKSSIIDFVEEQPQVDFVTDFRLYHKIDKDAPPEGWTPVDVEVVEATTARSILVSAPRHVINEVPRDG